MALGTATRCPTTRKTARERFKAVSLVLIYCNGSSGIAFGKNPISTAMSSRARISCTAAQGGGDTESIDVVILPLDAVMHVCVRGGLVPKVGTSFRAKYQSTFILWNGDLTSIAFGLIACARQPPASTYLQRDCLWGQWLELRFS